MCNMCYMPPFQIWASCGLRQELAKHIKELLEQNGYRTTLWPAFCPEFYTHELTTHELTIDGRFCDHGYSWIYINAETANPIQIIWGKYRNRTVVNLDPADPNVFDKILKLMPKRIPLWKIPYYRLIKRL